MNWFIPYEGNTFWKTFRIQMETGDFNVWEFWIVFYNDEWSKNINVFLDQVNMISISYKQYIFKCVKTQTISSRIWTLLTDSAFCMSLSHIGRKILEKKMYINSCKAKFLDISHLKINALTLL